MHTTTGNCEVFILGVWQPHSGAARITSLPTYLYLWQQHLYKGDNIRNETNDEIYHWTPCYGCTYVGDDGGRKKVQNSIVRDVRTVIIHFNYPFKHNKCNTMQFYYAILHIIFNSINTSRHTTVTNDNKNKISLFTLPHLSQQAPIYIYFF